MSALPVEVENRESRRGHLRPVKNATPVVRKHVHPGLWQAAHEIAARYQGSKITVDSASSVTIRLPSWARYGEDVPEVPEQDQ